MISFIKKKVKIIYKTIIINFFYLIYKKPKINNKKLDESEKIYNLKIDKNKYSIFEFQQGRIYTDSNDTTAYITANNNISDASLQYKKFDTINSRNQKTLNNEVLKIGTPKLKKKISGNLLSVVSGGASRNNFTHWLTDFQQMFFF